MPIPATLGIRHRGRLRLDSRRLHSAPPVIPGGTFVLIPPGPADRNRPAEPGGTNMET
jgi:hypothetical protein